MHQWFRRGLAVASLMGLMCMAAPVARADESVGLFPKYHQAMSDLQAADALLQMPDAQANIHNDSMRVEKPVRDAMGDIRHAKWWDNRPSNYTPPADLATDRPGRLHQINHLLHESLADLQAESDTSKANGWRNKAMRHIQEAMGKLQQVFVDAHVDFGETTVPPAGVP